MQKISSTGPAITIAIIPTAATDITIHRFKTPTLGSQSPPLPRERRHMIALLVRAQPQAGNTVEAGDAVGVGHVVEAGNAVEIGDMVEADDAVKDFWWWTLLVANQLLCLHPLILCLHQKCVQDLCRIKLRKILCMIE